MADIRVERKSGGHAWLWILLVVVLLVVAAWLLDRAGYIELPMTVGSSPAITSPEAHLANAGALQLQEG